MIPIDGILIGECSNPFMISRVLMKSLGVNSHGFYTIIEVTFAVLFLIARYLFPPHS